MPRVVKKAGIITNRLRDVDLSKTRKLAELLESFGIEPVFPEARVLPRQIQGSDAVFTKSDFIITLGGDGTILSIAEKAALCGIPIMGINIGNLGYLTDCGFEDAKAALDRVTRGDYTTEKRMMLSVSVPNADFSARCLNDVCVTRGKAAKIIRFRLYINGSFVDNYSADGIIISTPTGSTAYNLSAGGPVLMPHSEMLAITPICPHMLTARPIVAASDADVKIIIDGGTEQKTVMTTDGRETVDIVCGCELNVCKAETHTDIIKTKTLDFYSILREKLLPAE